MKLILFFLLVLLSPSLVLGQSPEPSDEIRAALDSIQAGDLSRHIQMLASDEFEGRMPASKGEELTIHYLAEQFEGLGLKPGALDGTYYQEVPLASITADPEMELVMSGDGGQETFHYGDQFMAWTKRVIEQSSLADSEVVFIGYGTQAPEYEWDDYKGMDVSGKTLIMLVGDPPIPDPDDPQKLDEKVFGGQAMTYYGRWTYKFEIAAEKGAAGCFIVHETDPAGYPWEVVKGSWRDEQFDLASPDKNMARCAVEGWLTSAAAKAIFAMAGQDLPALKKAAVSRDFKPIPLNLRSSISIHDTIRTIVSHNVIARVDGSDEELKNEYVIYTAHWDHLGRDVSREGDQIFNGALDNASGVAGLLELGEAFAGLPTPPRRSVIFLAVTAEEKGLLGSLHYASHPIYPLTRTVAEINMDGLNTLGRTRDVTIIGKGQSTLDDLAEFLARGQGRTVRPDPMPEKGFYYRSDHFNFAKKGVPALWIGSGVDYIGQPEGWGLKMQEKYIEEDYHKPSDEFDPNWDLSGAVQDLQLLFQIGVRTANAYDRPEWKPDSEFRAVRERMLKESGIKLD